MCINHNKIPQITSHIQWMLLKNQISKPWDNKIKS